MAELSERAINILHIFAGDIPVREWGAEDGIVLEELITSGLCTPTHEITDQGRERLTGS